MPQCKPSERWSESLQICIPNGMSGSGLPTNEAGNNTSAVSGKDPWLDAGDIPNILDSISRAWNVFRGGQPAPETVVVQQPAPGSSNAWVAPVLIVFGLIFLILMIVILVRSGKKNK